MGWGERLGRTCLHANVRVAHSAVDGEIGQFVPAVHFHCVEDRFGLVAGCFEGCASDVAALRVLGDAH